MTDLTTDVIYAGQRFAILAMFFIQFWMAKEERKKSELLASATFGHFKILIYQLKKGVV